MVASIWNPSAVVAPTSADQILYDWSIAYAAQTIGLAMQDRGVCVTDDPFNAIGDGVANDGAAIFLAIATGKNVFFPPNRTFLVNGYVFEPYNNQKLWGGGTLKKTTISVGGEQFFKIESKDKVTIDGLKFLDSRTSGSRSYGITVQASTNITIMNNEFQGYETPVFIWRNTNTYTIFNNLMKGVGGSFGIATGGDASGNVNGNVENGIIAFNKISNKTDEAIDINWDTVRCLIYGNQCIGNNTVSFEEEIDVGGGTCRDIFIVNNIINGNGTSSYGINYKLNTERILISGNEIFNVTISGIDNVSSVGPVKNLTITNNIILGSGVSTGRGINIDVVDGYEISGNFISGFLDDGITTRANSPNGVITNNKITENQDGIVALGPRSIISNNNVYANTVNGINLQALHLTCNGNSIHENPNWGLVVTAGSNYAMITGNNIFDKDGTSGVQDSILFTGASDRVICSYNICYPFDTTAISGSGALTNSIVGNNIVA